jgi:hypothetical protein
MEASERHKIAESLRKLADLVDDGGSVSSVDIETERVGHMVKTSVVLWSVAPDAVPVMRQVQWCDRLIPHFGAPDTLCRQMLRDDGTCPREIAHRVSARRW